MNGTNGKTSFASTSAQARVIELGRMLKRYGHLTYLLVGVVAVAGSVIIALRASSLDLAAVMTLAFGLFCIQQARQRGRDARTCAAELLDARAGDPNHPHQIPVRAVLNRQRDNRREPLLHLSAFTGAAILMVLHRAPWAAMQPWSLYGLPLDPLALVALGALAALVALHMAFARIDARPVRLLEAGRVDDAYFAHLRSAIMLGRLNRVAFVASYVLLAALTVMLGTFAPKVAFGCALGLTFLVFPLFHWCMLAPAAIEAQERLMFGVCDLPSTLREFESSMERRITGVDQAVANDPNERVAILNRLAARRRLTIGLLRFLPLMLLSIPIACVILALTVAHAEAWLLRPRSWWIEGLRAGGTELKTRIALHRRLAAWSPWARGVRATAYAMLLCWLGFHLMVDGADAPPAAMIAVALVAAAWTAVMAMSAHRRAREREAAIADGRIAFPWAEDWLPRELCVLGGLPRT